MIKKLLQKFDRNKQCDVVYNDVEERIEMEAFKNDKYVGNEKKWLNLKLKKVALTKQHITMLSF